MKILITHANGFMGSHLIDLLLQEGQDSPKIFGLYSPQTPTLKNLKHIENFLQKIELREVSCTHSVGINNVLADIKPDVIFHFERFTQPGHAWENSHDAFELNVSGTINLLKAVSQNQSLARVVVESSAAIYGHVAWEDLPLKESSPLRLNEKSGPFEWSVVAEEAYIRKFIIENNLDVVIGRSFNIEGPRRRTAFVTSDFASQIASLEKEQQENSIIKVGNLAPYRDWTDVRDAVLAYYLLSQKGQKGQVYNIGSGEIKSINEILASLIGISQLKNYQIVVDAKKMRPTDIAMLQADYSKLKEATGWEPKITYAQMIRDILDDWRRRVYENEYDE